MTIATNDIPAKVSSFLIEQLKEKEIRTCSVIELTHTPPGLRPEVLKEWRRTDEASAPYFHNDDKERTAYLEQLAIDIVSLAEERADIFRGADNVFKVRTIQLGGGQRGYPFRVMPSAEIDGGGGMGGMMGDFPANPSGVLGMQMRNNEFHMRMNKDMVAGTVGTLTTLLSDAREENKALRTEIKELRAEINSNRAAEAERELAVVRQAGQESRKDLFVGKAVQLLPVVASRLLPENASAGAGGEALKALLGDLGKSLNGSQVAALQNVLTMEQRMVFGEVMRIATQAATPTASPSAATVGRVNDGSAKDPQAINGTPAKPA